MNDISEENVQSNNVIVRRGGFGDFMFRDFDHHHTLESESSPLTSPQGTTSHSTIDSSSLTQSSPSRNNMNSKGWRNFPQSNTQIKSSWESGNMWELRIRKRK